MLEKIGVSSVRALFKPVPSELMLDEELDLPEAKSEMEIIKHMEELGMENLASEMTSFQGGGVYRHYCPSLVDQLLLRSEFYTSYTPYQPEVSQGTLQTIFEFQTMISNLFGMDVSNASMYDGATAAAEAVLMALKISRKKGKVFLAATMHPHYVETIKTYVEFIADSVELLEMDEKTGKVKESELGKIDDEAACVLFQYPNYFGVIEDVHALANAARDKKALVIPVIAEATSLGILTTPGDIGADIAVGEGQALGIPMHFGGPGLGLFTCSDKLVRKMPGRLVGQTIDRNGTSCYVLTLAAREQHIKREKATSNICTNQGLMATSAAMYLAAMGKSGLKDVALMNLKRAEYLKKKIVEETGCKIRFNSPTYNEFTITVPGNAKDVLEEMRAEGIVGGIPASRYFDGMDDALIVNTTEMHEYDDLDSYVEILGRVAGGAK
jgi:glycine dehydrogenase subunit 1